MVKRTKLRRVGNSAGATLPKAMLDRLQVGVNDTMYVIEVDNGILLTPYDPTFGALMDAFQEGMTAYRNAMLELAKK